MPLDKNKSIVNLEENDRNIHLFLSSNGFLMSSKVSHILQNIFLFLENKGFDYISLLHRSKYSFFTPNSKYIKIIVGDISSILIEKYMYHQGKRMSP